MILLMLAAQLVYAAPPIPEGYTLIGGPGEARAVTEARFGPFVGAPEERAAAFFAAHGALLGVQGPMEVTRAPTWRGRTFVHVRQTFGGVPVAGGSATVKVDGDYVTWASGAFVDVPATLSVTPTLTAAQAAARATEGGGLAGAPVLWIERVGSRSVLAWRVPVARSQVDHVERSIDATTGAVVRVRSLGRSADGRAYLANMGTDLEDVPLDGLAAGETVLVADSARVRTRTFDGAVASSEHVAVADGAGDFLYDPTSEAEARRRACIHNDLSEVTGRDVCKGKGPWVVQTGHMHFHDHNTIILPLPAGRFALFAYFTGGGCRGGEQASLELRGDVIEVSEQIVGIAADASLCDDGPRDAMSGACIASTEQRTTFHDAGTGKALLVLSEREPGERFSIQGTKLRRSGVAGCDETVDLRRLPPHLKPHP